MSVPVGARAVIVWNADAAMTMQRLTTTTRLSMPGGILDGGNAPVWRQAV
jgi:hypothetical protein